MGHVALGDRRGWLVALLQPLSIVVLAVIAVQLIDGTRWLVVFPPLVALLAVWIIQALHAYRRAIELGAPRGGELQAALFLPAAVAVLTIFWLAGGRHGSPSATLETYVLAWMGGRPEPAAELYVSRPVVDDVRLAWSSQSAYLTERLAIMAAQYGAGSGLDPLRPFDSLRFSDPVGAGPRRQVVEIDIVRRERVETTILGIVPTASQQTVVVERLGTITLALVDEPPVDWLPFGRLSSSAWRIESVAIGPQ